MHLVPPFVRHYLSKAVDLTRDAWARSQPTPPAPPSSPDAKDLSDAKTPGPILSGSTPPFDPGMRVKVRLTTPELQKQQQQPPPDPGSDPSLTAFSVLFASDPIVDRDENGWYLSTSFLDQADDDDLAGTGRLFGVEAAKLLAEMNGVLRLLHVNPTFMEPVLQVPGSRAEGIKSPARIRVSGISGFSPTTDYLEPLSAHALLQLAENEPPVRRTLELLARSDAEWFWFDMYRVWEQMRGYFPDDRKGKADFEAWVGGLDPSYAQALVDFEDTANNPAYGPDRRHGKRNYTPRKMGLTPQQMQPDDARRFIHRLAVKWIELEYQVTLDPQFDHIS